MPIAAPGSAKAALRRAMLERRRAAHRAGWDAAARAVEAHVLAALASPDRIIAGYWPLGDELDCRAALAALAGAGVQVALPVVAGQQEVLIFRRWAPGDDLDQGPFGTLHPGVRAAVVRPDVLLVPLIAYDRRGHRLGYGAGYYDRTIAAFRAQGAGGSDNQGRIVAVGLAYAAQEVDEVPADTHDQALDGVITDGGPLWFGTVSRQNM